VVRSVPARGHAGAGTGAGAVQCPRCTTHKLFVSEGVRQPEAFECFECSARGQGARWHCALCRSDLCDACYATRAARPRSGGAAPERGVWKTFKSGPLAPRATTRPVRRVRTGEVLRARSPPHPPARASVQCHARAPADTREPHATGNSPAQGGPASASLGGVRRGRVGKGYALPAARACGYAHRAPRRTKQSARARARGRVGCRGGRTCANVFLRVRSYVRRVVLQRRTCGITSKGHRNGEPARGGQGWAGGSGPKARSWRTAHRSPRSATLSMALAPTQVNLHHGNLFKGLWTR